MLFNSVDVAVWEAVLDQYSEALGHHVASKKDDSLLALDDWYQNKLPEQLQSRHPMSIDSKELCELMSWKLKRGKFRPSLAKLAASNADVDVRRISQEAFTLVPRNLKAAITKMAELKGVGPATASAILCAGAPNEVPFMADETMDSVPGLGPIAYTIPYYLKFASKVIEKAATLKAKGSVAVNTPHLVEKALWTDYMMTKYGIQRKAQGSKDAQGQGGKEGPRSGKSKRKAETPVDGSVANEDKSGSSEKKAKTKTESTLPTPSTRSSKRRTQQ